MKVILDLPMPPSNNVYYRRGKFATYLSEQGRAYKQLVADIISDTCDAKFEDKRLRVHINLHPATRRKMDIDNRLKALADSLENAGLFFSDEQIDDLRIVRCGVLSGGRVTVIVEAIDG
jgi:crossover junction endodeoxyribonuclease RusA